MRKIIGYVDNRPVYFNEESGLLTVYGTWIMITDANRDVEDYVFGDDLEHGFIHISAQDAIAKIKEYEENYMIPRQNAIKSHLRNLLNEYTQSEIEAALYSMEDTDGKED